MLDMKYFVLKPRSKHAADRYAQASRKAMRAYANHIRKVDEQLSNELLAWAQKETNNETLLRTNYEITKIRPGIC